MSMFFDLWIAQPNFRNASQFPWKLTPFGLSLEDEKDVRATLRHQYRARNWTVAKNHIWALFKFPFKKPLLVRTVRKNSVANLVEDAINNPRSS